MSTKPSGGPAYPTRDYWDEDQSHRHEHGMSLRDWFAGQVLAGMMANQYTQSSVAGLSPKGDGSAIMSINALMAYAYADAMIAEREK